MRNKVSIGSNAIVFAVDQHFLCGHLKLLNLASTRDVLRQIKQGGDFTETGGDISRFFSFSMNTDYLRLEYYSCFLTRLEKFLGVTIFHQL